MLPVSIPAALWFPYFIPIMLLCTLMAVMGLVFVLRYLAAIIFPTRGSQWYWSTHLAQWHQIAVFPRMQQHSCNSWALVNQFNITVLDVTQSFLNVSRFRLYGYSTLAVHVLLYVNSYVHSSHVAVSSHRPYTTELSSPMLLSPVLSALVMDSRWGPLCHRNMYVYIRSRGEAFGPVLWA